MSSSKKFPANQLVEKLKQTGHIGPMAQLVGYIGSTSPDGMVQIHPMLEDLSQYLEVRESDIIHVEQAPESVLPHGGSYIWLKVDAEIKHTAEPVKREARFLAGDIAGRYMPLGPSPSLAGAQARGWEPPEGVARITLPETPCPNLETKFRCTVDFPCRITQDGFTCYQARCSRRCW